MHEVRLAGIVTCMWWGWLVVTCIYAWGGAGWHSDRHVVGLAGSDMHAWGGAGWHSDMHVVGLAGSDMHAWGGAGW